MIWNLFFRKWDKTFFKSWGGLKEELQGELRHGSGDQPVEQICANDIENQHDQNTKDRGDSRTDQFLHYALKLYLCRVSDKAGYSLQGRANQKGKNLKLQTRSTVSKQSPSSREYALEF